MDEKERKEQEREDFCKTGGMVTRIEFYTCFMVLFALILWRGGLVNQNLEMRMWNAEKNTIHEIDALWNDVNREIEAIPEKIREERDSPFWNPGMEIAGVNRKAGTFRLAIQATPKGRFMLPVMTESVLFYRDCLTKAGYCGQKRNCRFAGRFPQRRF